MLEILRQPYPAVTESMRKIRVAIISGLVVGLFLFTFRPFGIDSAQISHIELFIWGYGAVTAVALLVLLFGFPLLFPRVFVEETWTVGKNILFFILIILVIGSANLYYTHVVAGLPLSLRSFLAFQAYTAYVSLVVASTATFIRYATNLKRYQREAVLINRDLDARQHQLNSQQAVLESKGETSFIVKSENEKEELMLTPDNFLYIESADNYSDVCFLQNGLVVHRLIRSSLKRIEENLPNAFCFRCHRSYIINLYKVESLSGNSQGYKLLLHEADKSIPVSRRFNEIIVDRLKVTKALSHAR